jgi:hypothetical protein
MSPLSLLAPAGALVLLAVSLPCRALDLAGTPWETVAKRHGLDPALLYAVAIQATARPSGAGSMSPWPWTLRTQAGPRFYESRTAALADLRAMTEKSDDIADDIDVGLMQVNLKRHGHHFGDPATLLDARINLLVAAGILADAVDSAPRDLALAIGRYRHPSDERAARAYGRRILRLRNALDFSLGALVGAGALAGRRTPVLSDRIEENKGAEAFLDRVAKNCGKLSVGNQRLDYLPDESSNDAFFIDESSKLYLGKVDRNSYSKYINALYPSDDNRPALDCIFEQLPE